MYGLPAHQSPVEWLHERAANSDMQIINEDSKMQLVQRLYDFSRSHSWPDELTNLYIDDEDTLTELDRKSVV